MPTPTPDADFVTVDGMTMAYGDFVVQEDLSFSIRRGSVFVVMGDSGSGKSTLMRHMIGLDRPAERRRPLRRHALLELLRAGAAPAPAAGSACSSRVPASSAR